MSEQVTRTRRKRKVKTAYWTLTRINHKNGYKFVEDFGKLYKMYKKYGDAFKYFCADVLNEAGEYTYRLDEFDHSIYGLKPRWRMKAYRNHKAWIDAEASIKMGYPVILVSRADHKKLYRQGKIDKKEFDTLEYLKRRYPGLYKAREKLIKNQLRRQKKIAKLLRKGKAVPL